ncbi:MAG: hypothetical protein AB7I27_05900 [Bacteriovoracaceae bacterium]
MIWALFLIPFAFADDDLNVIKNLETKLPHISFERSEDELNRNEIKKRESKPLNQVTPLHEIETSGTEFGYIPAGQTLIQIKDNKTFTVTRPIYVRYFKLQDELGHKYLLNKDDSCTFKIAGASVAAVKHELELYEAPTKFHPTPKQIVKKEFDENLALSPEAFYFLGYTQGDYMKDLFNDSQARKGITNQIAGHFMGKLNLFVNPGLSVHYERTQYDLSSGGSVNYTGLSFGPRLRSKDFNIKEFLVRFNAEVRMSPWAHAAAKTSNGNVTYDFNSTDLFLSAEHQIKNSWGEFGVGVFFQQQWLNIKNQKEIVKLDSNSHTNKSIGLSIGQVF